jgi:hypothetical protein
VVFTCEFIGVDVQLCRETEQWIWGIIILMGSNPLEIQPTMSFLLSNVNFVGDIPITQ